MKRLILLPLLLLLAIFTPIFVEAQEDYQASPENLQARGEFQEAKSGLLISTPEKQQGEPDMIIEVNLK